jgi:large subunit ribosomal protein L21
MTDFAIIQTGGKQYRVKDGDTIRVEHLPDDEGDTVVIDDVRMVSVNGDISVGTPRVSGASVTTEVINKGLDKKVVVFKYKAKTRYRRKSGHRQQFTDLRISEISIG